MYDWKNPLYQSALDAMDDMDLSSFRRIAEYFRLLGGYKDSAALRKNCLSFPLKYYETLMSRLRSVKTTADLNAVVREMDNLRTTVGEAVFLDTEWQERNQAFLDVLKKRQRKVFFIENRKAVALAGLVLLLVLFRLGSSLYDSLRPGTLVSKGDRAYQDGDYRSAVSFYEDAAKAAEDGYRKNKEFQDKLKEAWLLAGKEEMEKGAYSSALSYFEKAEEDSLIQEASLAWAEQLLEQGDPSSAASHLDKAGNSEKADTLRKKLISLLTEEEDYSRAIVLLRQFKDPAMVENDLQTLCRKRAEKQVQAVLELDQPDLEAVKKLGLAIDDVDGQLFFTRALANAGCNPYQVYPGGVVVKDLTLPFYDFSNASGDAKPDTSKVLAVSLQQNLRIMTPTDMLSSLASYRKQGSSEDPDSPDDPDISRMTVQLLPAIPYSLQGPFRAETLSECTAYLLIRTYYLPSDPVEGVYHNISTTGKIQDYKSKYDTLERHDEVFLCDRNTPEIIRLVGRKVNPAPALTASKDPENTAPVFEYTNLELLKSPSELIGQPDNEWLRSVLNEAIDLINHQEG